MTPLQLVWFDLTQGIPVSLGVLRRELGFWSTLRVLHHFIWRQVTHRPFASLERAAPISPAERFTRRQLAPVLHLDEVLHNTLGLDQQRVMMLLARVVGATGARFIRHAVGVPSPDVWQRMSATQRRAVAATSLDQFLNAEILTIEEPGVSFAFNVTHCHFVKLCGELNRPALANLFCGADEVLFGDARFGVELRRESTLAAGDETCTFRFHWDDSPTTHPVDGDP